MSVNDKLFRIIIVDDQHDVRRVLRGAVESIGSNFHVIDTPSAEEAWLIISSQHVDLLVLDVRLPGISGLEFFERLRSRKKDIKVILITGVADPHIRSQASKSRADAFFLKPVGMVEFQECVKSLLSPDKGTGTASEADVLKEEPGEISVKGVLSELKKKTSAEGVFLLDRDVKVLCSVGSLPIWLTETGWVHSLILSYRIGIHKLFSEKTAASQSKLVISGPGLQLIFITLNTDYVLLLWSDKENQLSPVPVDDLKKLTSDISDRLKAFLDQDSLSKPSVQEPLSSNHIQPSEILEKPDMSQKDIDIEGLIQEGQKDRLGTKELNSYWETLTSREGKRYEREKDSISFDEAKEMGLALDREDEQKT
jgi:CheY-like chemotaxis protein